VRLSIKTKIFLACASTIGLVVWLIGFLVQSQESVAGLMEEMIQKNMAAMRMAEQIKYNFVLYDDLVFRYLFTEDKTLLAEGRRVRDRVHGGIHQMKVLTKGQTEQELLAEIEEETSRYDEDVKRLLDLYAFSTEDQKKDVVDLIRSIESGGALRRMSVREKQKQVLALQSAEGRARLTRLYSQCEKLVDISRSKLEDAQQRVRDTVEKTRSTALVSGGAVVLGSALVGLILAVSLLSPLKNLLRGVKKVTAGELNLELPVEGSDEVGRLTGEFNTMTRYLREKQERLTNETITDSLTELYNFRHFQTHIREEISRAARYNHPFALLILDIDHFKHYNDTNGHQMGNVLLKQLAGALKETLRQEDFIARYGGEEFVVVLPETDASSAHVAADRLRQAVEQADFPGGHAQPQGRLTVSVGGAMFPLDGSTAISLLENADRALYSAKGLGRNRVVWASESGVLKGESL
jgi:diguanylate cyclase (GGDEF)-like protein